MLESLEWKKTLVPYEYGMEATRHYDHISYGLFAFHATKIKTMFAFKNLYIVISMKMFMNLSKI